MKVFKLIIIFIIILGGVIGAFFLLNGGTGSKKITLSDETHETYRNQFQEDWKSVGDWDETIFSSHCDLIKQLEVDHDVRTLRNLNTSTAVEVVNDAVFKEWGSAGCRKSEIDKYVKAIGIIEDADSDAKENPVVKTIKSVDGTYRSALSLAHQSIGLTPSFNGTSWNSYANYRTEMLNKRNNILGNQNYKSYLSNISEIKEGLNAIPGKLDKGRDNFYSALAAKIIAYFNRIPKENRSRTDLNNLSSARNQYQVEYRSNEALNSFVREFKEDVNNNT